MQLAPMSKQMISFQKNLFENSFNAMTMVMEQNETMVKSFMEQMPWMPEEGKKTVLDAIEYSKKARDDFKKSVDDGFAKMEELFVVK